MNSFDVLVQIQAKNSLMLLGGVEGIYNHSVDIPTVVLIERDMEVATENGLAYVKRTVLSLLKADVGRVEMNATVTVTSDELTEVFTVAGFVSEDDAIVQVYVG